MKHVHFFPREGLRYARGIAGKRVLLLGESHYCASPDEAVPQLTERVITDLLDADSEHEPYKNTYTKFERALAGKPLSPAEKAEVWSSVVFYNFVQQALSGPRVAPTAEQFRASAPAFFEVLEHYRPHLVIAWGSRLYNNLPKGGSQLPDLGVPGGEELEWWQYRLADGHPVAVLPIMHPSAAGFVPSYWHGVIAAALEARDGM